jgi:parallel beta-helix repeat protein
LKKTALTILIIFCLPTLILNNYKIPVKASSTTWIVDIRPEQGNFTSIQEAINAANPGDTILVHNGTYYENLVINKSLTLIGENRDYTILNGSKTDNVILIKASSVSVRRFVITGGGGLYYSSGIYVESSWGNIICDNKLIDNIRGISLYRSRNNTIHNNIIMARHFDGIFLYSSTNNLISDNTISSNRYGIYAESSSGNAIYRNLILNNNPSGITLHYSQNNMIYCNTISDNINGLALEKSPSNVIYRNNFINNLKHVSSDSQDTWSYDGEGNYWDEYAGHDLNRDGIGDTPYSIDISNKDDFPLMGLSYGFDIAYNEKTYSVALISNSEISGFNFETGNETGNKILRFNAGSKGGSFGFCRITIPIELMEYPYIVLVDGIIVVPAYLNISEEAFTRIYFDYSLENAHISIISSEALRLYYELLVRYNALNQSYGNLLSGYIALSASYNVLQESFNDLNASYQQLLFDYSLQSQLIQNFIYVAVFSVAVFIVVTVYLSKHAHARLTSRVKVVEDEE